MLSMGQLSVMRKIILKNWKWLSKRLKVERAIILVMLIILLRMLHLIKQMLSYAESLVWKKLL